MSYNYLLRQEQCPICRTSGKDTQQDNLAVYSDGHSYCYGCGYYKQPKLSIEVVKEKLILQEKVDRIIPADNSCAPLPDDITPNLDATAKRWLLGYGLAAKEQAKFWWSPEYKQLIFPIFDREGYLLFWHARNFNKDKPKYYTSGQIHEHFHFEQEGYGSRPLVVVEDIVSAIKVGKTYKALPLFGAHLSDKRMIQLRDYVLPLENEHYKNEIGFWLDSDKTKESIRLKNKAQELGFNAWYLSTRDDPKSYLVSKIQQMVYRARHGLK